MYYGGDETGKPRKDHGCSLAMSLVGREEQGECGGANAIKPGDSVGSGIIGTRYTEG